MEEKAKQASKHLQGESTSEANKAVPKSSKKGFMDQVLGQLVSGEAFTRKAAAMRQRSGSVSSPHVPKRGKSGKGAAPSSESRCALPRLMKDSDGGSDYDDDSLYSDEDSFKPKAGKRMPLKLSALPAPAVRCGVAMVDGMATVDGTRRTWARTRLQASALHLTRSASANISRCR